jgi:RNA polymerase sigma-70 factor (ECF subfamily)
MGERTQPAQSASSATPPTPASPGKAERPAQVGKTTEKTLAPATFERFLLHTQGPLHGFVRSLAGDGEEAHDLVQEVFVAAWRLAQSSRPPFTANGDEMACRRWLFHAAYCRAVSLLRHRSVIAWESLDLPIIGVAPRQPAAPTLEEQVVERDALHTALATLEPPDVACLVLRVIEGFSSVEIAQILDIAPDAARKRLSRAMRRLRAAYFAQEEEHS